MAKPLVPWIGGKRKLAPKILSQFPDHKCYIEPFCGAGALFFMKEPSKSEVLNDINGDLVNLYRVVKHHVEELHRQFKWVLCSRQNWDWLKVTEVATLTDVQRAARFLYMQKLAFGGKACGRSFGTDTTSRPRLNLLTLEQDLVDAHLRLSRATIEHKDWFDVCQRYDRQHSLFYCDPPYWQTEGYGVKFEWAEYEKLASFMATAKGSVILSINAHPDIRKLFSGFSMQTVKYTYTVAGGHKGKSGGEMIVRNWGGRAKRKRSA